MAHKKAGGSTRDGRDLESEHPDVKLFGGQVVKAGNILVCQRDTKFHTGYGVGLGKDHTPFAKVDGMVKPETRDTFGRRCVSIVAA